MSTAILGNPSLWSDEIGYASASTVTATKGDWLIFSGQVLTPALTGTIAANAHKASAAGIALANNPTYDELGRTIVNTALPYLRHGVIRVSAGNSGTALTIPLGSRAYPGSTASGIVGQTGATGVGPIWATAVTVLASGTAAPSVGVGIVVAHPVGGDSGVGQIDVAFNVFGLYNYT